MRTTCLLLATALIAGSIGIHAAAALEIDQTTGTNKDGSSRFGDPDDAISFPHVSDDGQPSNNFQAQPIGNSGVSFGFTPSNAGADAFQRAQDRMQQ